MDNQSVDLLNKAASIYSSKELASKLEVSQSTVSRWLHGKAAPKPYIADRLSNLLDVHVAEPSPGYGFRFIDLFAGIGGLRLGFEQAGGRCVFTSEWDTYAQKTYRANFHESGEIFGDITKIDPEQVPDHEVLLAGFPCQPFSIAGVSKKNSLSMPHGFADLTQGTLFFDVVRVIESKRPEVVILENVKNLRSHDKGHTYQTIMGTLQKDLGYVVDDHIFDGQHWVPQHRERIVIAAFKNPVLFSFRNLPLPQKGQTKMGDILHRTDGTEPYIPHDGDRYFDFRTGSVQERYTLSDKLWTYLQAYATKHRSLGNGFGFGLVNGDSIARTLSARYYKDGSEILVDQGVGRNPRRLTPREAARLMGYPDEFVIPVSDTRAYKQFGNSVVVPLFRHIAGYVARMVLAQTALN
ncbi:MAG: DNA (cytosine-5-)-methyltransferase [Verrucomicrobia bacterium]|jgi:DNA (cytosine-5)-methyltransferase 1|nr:DNA (cytosine-5-)-methyltransferase [Verrucomicrobiota bacterium]